jgi:diaminopimelate decarboxylase
MVADQPLRRLAETYGTPLYAYDGETIAYQIQRLRDALGLFYPGGSQITYAAKAYFSLGIARHLASAGLGVDVVSLGELGIARRAGFPAQRVHIHGNNKTAEELLAAIEWGVQSIVVDNLDELELLEQLAHARKQAAKVWLRISPDVVVNTHAFLQTAHASSKFGMGIGDGQADEAIGRVLASRFLKLTGLHVHLGSQFREADPYREAVERLMVLAEKNHFVPEEISPGGGWGVPYLPEQTEDDPQPWIQTVSGALQDACTRRNWALPRLVVEPGRWIIARAGLALYTIGATKTSADGTHFVAVDGGMADNPRPALYDARYIALLPERPDAVPAHHCSVVGRYCESGDLLIREAWLPETRRGDLLMLPVAGAYQLSMASNYNLAPRPAVLWLEHGQVEVLQQRERLEEGGWWMGD